MKIGIVNGKLYADAVQKYGDKKMSDNHPGVDAGHWKMGGYGMYYEANPEWDKIFPKYEAESNEILAKTAKAKGVDIVLKRESVLFLDQEDAVDITEDVMKTLKEAM